MSYKLEKPYTETEYADFVVEHNHNNGLKIEETDTAVFALEKDEIIKDGEVVKNENYAELQATLREATFKAQFFEIGDWGWFRKVPKGYSSAVEAMSAAFNMVTILGHLPANTLTFYAAPDFADENECTETWLIDNSIKNSELSAADFGALYTQFLQAWNEIEHF